MELCLQFSCTRYILLFKNIQKLSLWTLF
jgi:hypothetical protein